MNLPNEVLSEILGCLPSPSCYSITLVSRYLRQNAEPHLYRSVVGDAMAVKGFNALTDTVKTRPALGAHVRSLRLGANISGSKRLDELFLALPNLHELYIVRPMNNLQVQRLSNLHTLVLDYDMGPFDYNRQDIPLELRVKPLEIIARHFWMPSLRHLQVSGIDFGEEGGDSAFVDSGVGNDGLSQGVLSSLRTPIKKSPITTLCLMDCDDRSLGGLPNILASVKRLERFTFGIYCPWPASAPGTPGISPATLKLSLDPHAETLTELIIVGNDAAHFLQITLFGTLTHFKNLKRLAIPEPFIAAENVSIMHQMLPSSLEDLQLQYPMGFSHELDGRRGERYDKIRDLATSTPVHLAQLKRVIWWYQQADCCCDDGKKARLDNADILSGLTQCFEHVGVQFDSLSTPFYEHTPFANGPA